MLLYAFGWRPSMPVTRMSPDDSEKMKKRKLKEIEEAKRSLEATREAIKREFGEPSPDNRFGQQG